MPLFSHRKPRPKLRQKKAFAIDVDNVREGVNILISETRLRKNEAKELLNMLLIEDGVPTKRWGTKQYGGVTWDNTPDGAGEFRDTDGTRDLIVIADGYGWRVNPGAGTKQQLSGATFTQGVRCKLLQFGGYLYITNGTDVLARYDGSTTLQTYTALTTPVWAGTPIARTGLSTGNFDYYYRVSAQNEVGETIASTEQTIDTNVSRDEWDDSNYLTLDWDAVSGATKYIIYMSDISGYETKLAETTNDGYVDNGSAVLNPYIEPPEDNTTAGPKLLDIWVSGNRLWGTDAENKQRVQFTGTGVNRGNFSPAFGGGWIDLERGSRLQVTAGSDFQGTSHVFCMTDEGRGSVWQVSVENQTISGTTFSVPIPTKIIANIGTPAIRSLIYVENDMFMYSPSQGVMVFGNEPNILGVLRTNEISAKIRPNIRSVAPGKEGQVAAYYYEAKVFISFADVDGENNKTWIFDRERAAFVGPWTVGCEQFFEYTDSSDVTHFLAISGNKLIEFSDNLESDEGEAFTWRYTSPRFPIADDWSLFARVPKALIRMRNANGSIELSVYGTGVSEESNTLASETIQPTTSQSGIGWDQIGNFLLGSTNGAPSTFATESQVKYLRLPHTKSLIRDIQWQISGNAVQDQATIIGLRTRGRIDERSEPLSWKV